VYKATVNGKDFEIVPGEDGFVINGQPLNWDKVKITDSYFHILIQNKSYRVEVVKVDPVVKTVTLKINGHTYAVEIKDKFDLLLEKLGMNTAAGSKINNIKAPMPGLIIDLKVQAGSSVMAGDPLLILEAMKMENIIKSPGQGTVKNVKVKKGDSVEKGQVLLEF
jgi:biotin carboxyl carrier protein